MDYVFKAQNAIDALVRGGADFVMGYARHDLYCDFFKKYYSFYSEKVIELPFGSGSRFKSIVPFEQRENRCIALGAVNPVDDPLCNPRTIDEYRCFYQNKKWTHEFRRQLVENEKELGGLVNSRLPHFPETKNSSYDPVMELNQHRFFVNDEGLLNFPPARTFEGMASGCVMVASENPIYRSLGFKDGENYISFKKNDLNDFRCKLEEYIKSPKKSNMLHLKGIELSKNFTHTAIADRLFSQIKLLSDS
jgi:hypothetical protein